MADSSKANSSKEVPSTPESLSDDQYAVDDFPPSTGSQLGSVEPHVFSHPARAEYWKNIFENARYECRHRFDPSFEWSPEKEAAVKKKVNPVLSSSSHRGMNRYHVPSIMLQPPSWLFLLRFRFILFHATLGYTVMLISILVSQLDWRVMVWVWVMYSSLDLIRRNINRAVADNMLDDLNINTNDYNTGQTIYLVAFLAAELPGGLISKKIGPFRYTPAVIVLWGGLCMVQSAMNSRWNFFLLRALLGIAQGGFIPEMVSVPSPKYRGA